jgi:hypothetical protein
VLARSDELVAVIVGTSFAAGLNVYATLATLGLLARADVVTLPPPLRLLASWYVIGIAVALFVVEFFADKIPAFDLVWNALHTFVRVPIAALLAYGATAQLSPRTQLLSSLLAAAIALAAHGGKTAVRAAVTPSPEPLSNMALSLGEDVGAIFLTWLATRHPYLTAVIVAFLLIIIVVIIRWVFRALASLFRGAERTVSHRRSPVADLD